MKNITGEVACRNIMVFYVDGVLYKNGNSDTWDQPANVSILGDTQLVAVKCTYSRPVGIKMTLSNGFETSAEWKCTNKYHQGWNERGFKDDTWPNAEVVKNEWIWTARKKQDETVYCRKVLGDGAGKTNQITAKQHITQIQRQK
ncbi:hypothetical protein SNE40_017316 [Patella caerulea]|uniref:Uncharacterized protein n=1 Tax=Patella caerulea TaxID=87958 RepID=A0AAN8JBU0_PATCE